MPHRILALAIVLGFLGTLSSPASGHPLGIGSGRGRAEVIADKIDNADKSDNDGCAITLDGGLRAAARHLDETIIDALLRAYGYQLDLEQCATTDDSFRFLYTAGAGQQVLAAAVLSTGKDVRKLYRFRTSDGPVDYYDENGRSAQTALLRKPLRTGRLESGFGERENPVLGTVAMHTGVDWKGSFGAEVRAAGDGIVDKAGWQGAYGRYVRLRHADDYMTAYAHLSQFAPQIVPGARVSQGDMIGTVGSTGISSGPHLHYELLMRGRFVDPMRARLPHVRVLKGAELAAFVKERDSLDALLRDWDCDPGTADIRNVHSDRGYDLTCGHFIGERP